MKIIKQLAAVALTVGTMCFATPALAGKGGSNARIQTAVQSGSTDAIIAEVERAEGLLCEECVQTVTALTEDSRYAVREVAGWWFAKRPALNKVLAEQMVGDLQSTSSIKVRNAADYLGAVVQLDALPALRAAIQRSGLSGEAKVAIVRAAGLMAHVSGNPIFVTAMADSDASVRAAAVNAWREVLGQENATPVEARLGDSDAGVRAAAATVMGAFKDAQAVATLAQLVVSDASATVRRNAAWALGEIGAPEARTALVAATADSSPLVRGVAQVSLGRLR